ncbi:MAG: hypothetical protein HXY43_00970 [Fischerella sp.]|uniref:hypothetical protein n=1 Tax=Fischerella sp. TaxID=1191 RepID=UPI00180EA275|nr:hypothetical protein [Fischerella sp.]NWF57914.1 hypothetical protein [Fischerella sp.]
MLRSILCLALGELWERSLTLVIFILTQHSQSIYIDQGLQTTNAIFSQILFRFQTHHSFVNRTAIAPRHSVRAKK